MLVNVALKKVGRKYSQEQLDKDIARIDEFYLGNGWYIDGLHGQKDYYIGFAFHFYGLIYAVAMEDDDKERSDIYKERATEFAKTFIYCLTRTARHFLTVVHSHIVLHKRRFGVLVFWRI